MVRRSASTVQSSQGGDGNERCSTLTQDHPYGRSRMLKMSGLLVIGAVIAGISLDRRRRRERRRLPRTEIQRWEEEGGAIPMSRDPTEAETAPASVL
jgi:hypothetical protein